MRTETVVQNDITETLFNNNIAVPLHIIKAHGIVDAQLQSFSSSELNGGKL
jgi:hypothetical protein